MHEGRGIVDIAANTVRRICGDLIFPNRQSLATMRGTMKGRRMSDPQPPENRLLKPYQIITDKVLQMLEAGVAPWRKPWLDTGLPKNLNSGKPYRGINTFMLSMCGSAAGYGSPYWLTFNQAAARGGHVKKGEKSTPVVFWKIRDRKPVAGGEDDPSDDAEANTSNPTTVVKAREFPVLRHFYVFNVEQCAGIEYPQPQVAEHPFTPIERCEQIVQKMPRPPTIEMNLSRAFYSASRDLVNMPKPELFSSPEQFYATLYHEIGHASGHVSRLNRESLVEAAPFGSSTYAKEELIAEMTATFLCSEAGIEQATIENAAAYLQGWLSKLRSDPKLVVMAAAAAQRAADFILDNGREALSRADQSGSPSIHPR